LVRPANLVDSWPNGLVVGEELAIRKGLASMERVMGEVNTNVLDLSGMSLDDVRFADDPILAHSLHLLAERAMCSNTGVLQNQFREDI
jgi:hypothetical protein